MGGVNLKHQLLLNKKAAHYSLCRRIGANVSWIQTGEREDSHDMFKWIKLHSSMHSSAAPLRSGIRTPRIIIATGKMPNATIITSQSVSCCCYVTTRALFPCHVALSLQAAWLRQGRAIAHHWALGSSGSMRHRPCNESHAQAALWEWPFVLIETCASAVLMTSLS